jgi:hypothetical protein
MRLNAYRVTSMPAKKPTSKASRKAKAAPKRGRPTAYKAIYAEQAHAFCLLGADDKKLAELFQVGEATINRWKLAHPEFRESTKRAKEGADCQVAAALFQRAIGFSHPDVHISNFQGMITVTDIVKHYPPDTGAAFIWLKNRQPRLWRDRIEVQADITTSQANIDAVNEMLREKLARQAAEHADAMKNRESLKSRLGIGTAPPDGAD